MSEKPIAGIHHVTAIASDLHASASLNIRVADVWATYRKWRARGAQFLTEAKDHGREIISKTLTDIYWKQGSPPGSSINGKPPADQRPQSVRHDRRVVVHGFRPRRTV